MKYLFLITMFSFSCVCYSQISRDIFYFNSLKSDNDSSLKYLRPFLNKFDSTDEYKSLFFENAAERLGDYYNSKKDYLKAIAYYDSADTKYRNRFVVCGNAYYIDFIPRRFKVSQCYLKLQNLAEALKILTPYIFDEFGSQYFDNTMAEYYISMVRTLYSKEKIQEELKTSVEKVVYTTSYHWSKDSASKSIEISCKLQIFGSDLELAGFEYTSKKNDEIYFNDTKESLIAQFKKLQIYKRLEN